VAEAVVAGPAEIAVVGPPGDPRTAALHTTALLAAPPGAVIALGDGAAAGAGSGAAAGDVAAAGAAVGAAGGEGIGVVGGGGDGAGAAGAGPAEAVPLLAGRGLVAGAPAAYVCRDFTCRMPVTDPMELRAVLDYPAPAPAG
jgi:hypothetical protein